MKFRHKEEIKEFTHRHIEDVERMVRVCSENGIETDLQTCAFLWENFSLYASASWLNLEEYSDNALFDTLFRHAVYNNHLKGIDV
jgi:hypothetical protein